MRPFAALLLAGYLIASSFDQEARADSMSVVTPDSTVSVPAGTTSASVRIQLKNDEATTGSLTVWMLALEVTADAAAKGSVQFATVTQPDPYLLEGVTPFGPQLVLSGPPATSPPVTPTAMAIFSDAALLLPPGTGVEFPGNAVVNLFDLHLSVSPDAFGKFQIVLMPYEGPEPFESSWSTGPNPADALPFSNVTLAERTLVEINVVPEPTAAALAIGLLATPLMLKSRRSNKFSACRR